MKQELLEQWVEVNGKCYIFVAGADLSNDHAHGFCNGLQAKVVEPQSIAENQAISAAFDRTVCKELKSEYSLEQCTDYWIGVNSKFGSDQ